MSVSRCSGRFTKKKRKERGLGGVSKTHPCDSFGVLEWMLLQARLRCGVEVVEMGQGCQQGYAGAMHKKCF